jgi:hypothetical protein
VGAVFALPGFASFVFGFSAPDSEVLAGRQRPGKALGEHGAALADGLGLRKLVQGWSAGAEGEEQFGIVGTARRSVTPIHVGPFLLGGPAVDAGRWSCGW